MSQDRYTGEIRVPSTWHMLNEDKSLDPGRAIRLVGDNEDGGWLYEFVALNGRDSLGGKKKRISDGLLRLIYRPARCPMCGNLGWVTDCNDLGKPGPRMVEFLPCFYPECEVSGQPIQSLNFKGPKFTNVARHPSEGWVMSVSADLESA